MTDTSPIILTDIAVEHVKSLKEEQNIPSDHGLRVGVETGGCSGFSYTLGFGKAGEADEQYEVKGIKIFMDKDHKIYLHGMEIDFEHGIREQGFRFRNPNAGETCTCGSSFAAKEE